MRTLQVAATIASLLRLAAGRYERPPNATRSVNFKPFPNDDTEWTWRVNVTDYHRGTENYWIKIEYDFSWPGGGILESTPAALKSPNGTFCAMAPLSWGTPKNVTDRYTDANTNSIDCTPVLGAACVDAILAASADNDDGTRLGCGVVGRPYETWSQYPECADTFGIAEYALPGMHDRAALAAGGLPVRGYTESGEGFHFMTGGGGWDSDPPPPGMYESAVNMLQVVLLRTPVAEPGEPFTPTLNCMRVNTKEVVDVDSGAGSDDSEENTEDGNSGASRGVAAGSLWAVMGSLAVALL